MFKFLLILIFNILLFYPLVSIKAQEIKRAEMDVEKIASQQQRQNALEKRLTPSAKDVHLSHEPTRDGTIIFPDEEKCFLIKKVIFETENQQAAASFLQSLARQAEGKCLGAEGINLLMARLQDSIIARGYITTRIVAPSQDLKSGQLVLKIIEGRIGKVTLTENSDRFIQLYSTFPARDGDILYLRDIEQGLENLQRLPTMQAKVKIVPAEKPGESDLQVDWQQKKRWRLGLSLDDAGDRSTGRYQGGLSLSLDNPLSLGDLFYLSGLNDLNTKGGKGSQNITGHYSVPFGYWMFSLNAYKYDYHQIISGTYQDINYSGEVENITAKLSRVLYRGQKHKTSMSYEVIRRESHNFINDTELLGQQRKTAAWRAGLQHRHFFGQSTLDAAIGFQQGTGWFSASPSPEERYGLGSATAQSKISTVSLQLNHPFKIGNQHFRYSGKYFQQYSHDSLTPPEQFSIGNRWTVRGFDGRQTLAASRGYFLRNDLAWRTPFTNQELYLGVDYGKVSGTATQFLPGTILAGAQAGIRGYVFNIGYDVFAGIPLSKPGSFQTNPVTVGFNLDWSY